MEIILHRLLFRRDQVIAGTQPLEYNPHDSYLGEMSVCGESVMLCGMKRIRWNREQLVKVLALYCQLPFGKMHARNPAVIALASKIDRTPAAVAFKLANFASLDPELKKRDVGGMPNVSQADKRTWSEFYGRWEALADESVVDVCAETEATLRHHLTMPASPPSGPTVVDGEVKIRRGQAFFRAAVLAGYEWKCCVTGISALELLRASHIVPWSRNPDLRLDPRNGLCLNALHDAAFDRGLITFSDNYELCVSSILKNDIPTAVYLEMFEKRQGMPIATPKRYRPAAEMLEFHRHEVFRG